MTRFFRSTAAHVVLGIAMAVLVYFAFVTPIGGSFRDVVELQMNGVAQVSPVKAKIISEFDSTGMHFLRGQDLYGEQALIRTSTALGAKPNDIIVADLRYDASDRSYTLVQLIRTNPSFTFPLIQGLGELGRNMIFHVPMSMVAFIAFLLGTINSILFLFKKDLDYDRKARAASAVGTLFTLLATITGSIWAKFSWGTFWNWDPRETSIFILLLIYAAYFMLRSLLEESEEKKARIAAVYNIIAFVSVPFLMFVLPRITQSLHPGGGGTEAPILNLSGTTHTDRTLLNTHWISVLLFLFVFLWMKDLYTRILRIEFERIEPD